MSLSLFYYIIIYLTASMVNSSIKPIYINIYTYKSNNCLPIISSNLSNVNYLKREESISYR